MSSSMTFLSNRSLAAAACLIKLLTRMPCMLSRSSNTMRFKMVSRRRSRFVILGASIIKSFSSGAATAVLCLLPTSAPGSASTVIGGRSCFSCHEAGPVQPDAQLPEAQPELHDQLRS